MNIHKNFYATLCLGALSAALVGMCLGVLFTAITGASWSRFPLTIFSFGLGGLGIGWMGWQRANSQMAVALISLIAPLVSFSLVVYAFPSFFGIKIWDDIALGNGMTVFFWVLLIIVFGWFATTAASRNNWFASYTSKWQLFILVLMLGTLFGPWGYDELHIPGQYACEWPTFQVQDDFCGYPIPGIVAILTSPTVLLLTLPEIVNEATFRPYLFYRFGILFSLLTPLPMLVALFRRRSPEGARHPVVPVKIWAVAFIGGTGFLVWYSSLRSALLPLQVWGVWSYVLLTLIVLVKEGPPLVLQRGGDIWGHRRGSWND